MVKYSETLCIARRKSELPMDVTMPCKRGTMKRSSFHDFEAKRRESKKKIRNTKHACAVEAHESTRQRTESCPPKAKDRTR